MRKTIFVRDELLEEAGISAKTLKEWDRLQLLKPDGFTKDQVPFYAKETLERIKHIKGLHELGYEIKDIHKIIKRVGIPKTFNGQNKKMELKKF